jgi:hypothetical protein
MSEFATRVEEQPAPITAVDPPSGASLASRDFSTRANADETLFEPPESPAMIHSASTAQSPVLAPTEVVAAISVAEPAVERSRSSELYSPPPFDPPAPTPPQPASAWAPEPMPEQAPPPMPASSVVNPMKSPDAPEPERRTIVVADSSTPIHATKGRIVGWLITYSHNPDGEDFRIYAGYNRIGANPVCDIVVGDDTVSGSHAIIVYRDGRCLIKDDLSRNGTYVNGKEIGEAYPLQSYDQIRIGNTYLTFIASQRIT